MATRPIVFVLMPFEETYADVYEQLIKAPLDALGFEVRRADSLLNQQNILKDVVKGIADATLVIADVTGLNENVLYELGLAHALGKRTIMLTQRLEELPFDLRPYRTNEYSVLFNKADELKAILRDIGQAVLNNSADFGNPVQDFAPYALKQSTEASRVPAVSAGDHEAAAEEEEEEEEPGWLELLVAMQRGGERTGVIANEIADLTEQIGTRLSGHTDRLENAQKSLGDRAAGAFLAIARDAARDVDSYADALQPASQELSDALKTMTVGVNAMAREADIDTVDGARSAQETIEALMAAEGSMIEANNNIHAFVQTLSSIPRVDKRLSRAAKRAASVLTDTGEVLRTAQSEFTRTRGLLEERLG